MGNYWKTKVLPKIQKVFGKDPEKKAAALEAIKSFDESKEVTIKEFEEKHGELQSKVIEIYEASSTEIKSLVKEPKREGLKKHSAKVQKFLDQLTTIEFPGSKAISEASTKVGPALLPGPIIFLFEKVSTFLPKEEEAPVEAPPPEAAAVVEAAVVEEETVVVKEEVAVEVAEKAAEPSAVVEKAAPKVEAAEPPPPKVEESTPAGDQPKP